MYSRGEGEYQKGVYPLDFEESINGRQFAEQVTSNPLSKGRARDHRQWVGMCASSVDRRLGARVMSRGIQEIIIRPG